MSPRIGRPKVENAKDARIGVRLDQETVRKLDEVAALRNESRSEVIRRGIENEYKDAKKRG
ncbi:MAG: CopG family transcriptional regulator [Clostridia bacterium]|nr:CopG family transcriptional regulator [Clostridia bacterium]